MACAGKYARAREVLPTRALDIHARFVPESELREKYLYYKLEVMASAPGDAKYECQHCDALLSKKTFERHKRFYYDESTCQWVKRHCVSTEEPVCNFDEPSLELGALCPIQVSQIPLVFLETFLHLLSTLSCLKLMQT